MAVASAGRRSSTARTDARLVVAGGVALVATVALGALSRLAAPVDAGAADAIAAVRHPALETAARVVDRTFGGVGGVAVVVGVSVLVGARRCPRTGAAVAVAATLAWAGSEALKALFARARPEGGLLELANGSYPSGHTTTAAALAVGVVCALTVPRSGAGVRGVRPATVAAAALVVAVTAWSRLYLGVHFASDTAGGALLGAGVALVVVPGARLLIGRRGQRGGRGPSPGRVGAAPAA
jgi:membrane-associated phospholipid phosphatase